MYVLLYKFFTKNVSRHSECVNDRYIYIYRCTEVTRKGWIRNDYTNVTVTFIMDETKENRWFEERKFGSVKYGRGKAKKNGV